MTTEPLRPRISFTQQVMAWVTRYSIGRRLAVALVVAAILSGLATYVTLSGSTPFGPKPSTVLLLLNINLVLLLGLGAVVAKRLVQVWAERRRGLAGAKLHIRLVVLFSAVAVTPTIVVAVFSYVFLSFGMQSWFSERVKTALSESRAAAAGYLEEHQQTIRVEALAMANDLDHQAMMLVGNPEGLAHVVTQQALLRSLTEAMVFDRRGRLMATAGFTIAPEPIAAWAMNRADQGDVAMLQSSDDNRVRALVRLNEFPDAYLYIGRYIDPKVLHHMNATNEAVDQYEQLEGQRSGFQITFTLIFAVAALLLLVVAVWVGLNFATQMAGPISNLVVAAERVRGGDLSARVIEADDNDEFASLSRAFNRMTNQLETQQSELVEANRQLDFRRRFTETVLAGVSAGVIGLDDNGCINLPNRSASVLLGTDLDQRIGQKLGDVVPDMASLVEDAMRRPDRLVQGEIRIFARGRPSTLLVRIAVEADRRETGGFVVTFDDITELLSAQRKAAWADVARRIAHEMKNPLTPIQLSAERLKRKYLHEITGDRETFEICTDTIIRQVGDIGRMVDEFSSFARMPTPVLRQENLLEITRQALFLQRTAHSDISFDADLPTQPLLLTCDARLISQALINLLQNAVDAIHARQVATEGVALPGRIHVRLGTERGHTVLTVEDNGKGLPKEGRENLTEPYVTTRAKGTGLGLAIVKKIMEDHAGELTLDDLNGGGARVSLIFPTGAGRLADAASAEMPETAIPAINEA
ncbi:MAG TPA: PAS domain-containing sensor histidine kinase [Stellaceae bacterium]|nr:PAS domain-containing sensor histidine kinase [Stellaceae bacterium]